MLSQILIEYETVRKIENHEQRYDKERDGGIFLVIDEFAALRIALISERICRNQ